MTSTRAASIAGCTLLVLSMSATRFAPTRRSETDACKLLATADATTALEHPSSPGKHIVPQSSTECIWADDATASDTSRRVAMTIHKVVSFNAAKHTVIPTIKIEPVTGVGDEAFYALYPKDSPFLWVKKGDASIAVRILTRIKPAPPFTTDQFKAKLMVLAKTAIAKL